MAVYSSPELSIERLLVTSHPVPMRRDHTPRELLSDPFRRQIPTITRAMPAPPNRELRPS